MIGEDPVEDAKRFERTDKGVTLVTREMLARLGLTPRRGASGSTTIPAPRVIASCARPSSTVQGAPTCRMNCSKAWPTASQRCTLNRPDRLNALSSPIIDGLLEALPRLAADPEIAVVVLTGAGRGFCAGGDVKSMAEGTSQLGRKTRCSACAAGWRCRACCTRFRNRLSPW